MTNDGQIILCLAIGFISYPIFKFLMLAIWEKIMNDCDPIEEDN